ncbi:galectin-9-like [Hyperolius riggenbachi]|uniref:galectin-9-like n=1 Tax=Hyperolius riggenbachi TaxID=752182 RepID=UPI0035A26DB0
MSYGPIYNPPVPFTTHFHNGLNDGTMVVINGTVLPSGDRFTVNFQCESDDTVAFHFNPRFDGGAVVCNTKDKKNWGKEERKQPLPFHRGQPFEIRIAVSHHDYKVSVNRNHFLEYHHRIPMQRVKCLVINGCVSLSSVDIQGGGFPPFPGAPMGNPAYPPQPGYGAQQFPGFNPNQFPSGNFSVPYQTPIHGGLHPNRVIVIRGAVTGHPKRFAVNLKYHGGTAFHFNPRFDEHAIVRNSLLNSSWGSEERDLPRCGMCFSPGQSFVMEIICEHHAFRVNVNGNHMCNYNHRVPHLQQIDSLTIEGDVVLQHVQV